jgi:DNA-binding MarR family transcriptional regulator
MARQSGIGDSDSCRIILSILSASRAVRRALGRELDHELGFQDHSGSRCATLLTLYALDPLPATAADLTYHAEVSRASMTDIIKTLELHRMIKREAAGRDRSRPIRLTESGRQAAVFAVHRFLQLANNLAGDVGSPHGNATIETCEQVESRAAVSAA